MKLKIKHEMRILECLPSSQYKYVLQSTLPNQIFRLDRSHGRKGGGVAIYLLNQNGLKFSRRYDLERSYKALWLQVEINRKKYLFCCAYRAPDESLGIFGYLEDILHKATRENFEVIIEVISRR